MKIYGAGIAGLLAGNIFQDAEIFEAGNEGQVQHKALLRFRSTAVADAVGLEFKKVKVYKGIFYRGNFCEPNIAMANEYSMKVIGKLADRSIWNTETVERYIAQEDFISALASRCRGRIHWNHSLTSEEIFNSKCEAISTLPMNIMTKFFNENLARQGLYENQVVETQFNYEPITVRRWRVKNSDVYQTIYYPSENTNLFRASITGDLLIAEYMKKGGGDQEAADLHMICSSFGINASELEPIEKVSQRFGKIAPINDQWRKNFIYNLSTNYGIYSLGRFGTWRNLLLDDVIKDISVIKKLFNSSTYEKSKINAK